MKYFLDTEFLEGAQRKLFGFTSPTIDLISIGIVSEDSREYYAISRDFNLKEAWNRYDIQEQTPYEEYNGFSGRKVYWIRDNVLKPIGIELSLKKDPKYSINDIEYLWDELSNRERYIRMKLLITLYGKSNKQIAKEVKDFIYNDPKSNINTNHKFYGYYSAYDHVVLCGLFGKMIDLPKGFPMYTIDLKQELDYKIESANNKLLQNSKIDGKLFADCTFDEKLMLTKLHVKYPIQTNEHNALSDARWNKQLYEFLNII